MTEINNIPTSGIKKKKYRNMSQQLELYTYYSMNKQYVEEGTKKCLLNQVGKIAM